MRRRVILVGLGVAVVAAALFLGARQETESVARRKVSPSASPEIRGAAALEGAAFGGVSMHALKSNAVPWRLVAAALVLDEQARDPAAPADLATLDRILARFGFLPDAVVANLTEGAAPHALPLGFTYGDVAPVGGTRIRLANLGCSACHAGVTYAADGAPDSRRAMLGMPNTSIDLEAYTLAVFAALRRHTSSDRLIPTAQALFPEMSWPERQSLRLIVLPLAKQRLGALKDAGRPLPFPNGAPGSTNGVAALKAVFGLPLAGGGPDDAGVVSIPDLADRAWRTSLLVDGAYALPAGSRQQPTTAANLTDERLRSLASITTFFTVPSMGVHPDRALDNIDDGADVFAFLKAYRPQPFPGPIDQAAAAEGAGIYARTCSTCHGSLAETPQGPRLTRFPNYLGDVGTDPLRARMMNGDLARAISRTSYRDKISAKATGLYAAPPLAGVWASAPYLHNGSVPTLAALMSPGERPRRFLVGGHALDFERVGLRLAADGGYPAGYRPFSTPAWIDTASPGRSAAGHRYGEDLSPTEKRRLIEYLKRL